MPAPPTHMPSFYHHRNPAKDRDRPNVIFLSDIPVKLTECVASLHLYQGGQKRRVVDLAQNISRFEITLELNGLLLRNSRLTPSELVRKNLIFVARTKAPPKLPCRLVSQFPEVWQSVLAMRTAHETFVVSFTLSIAEFTVDLANIKETVLRFKDDESLEALNACDPVVLAHVEDYVLRKLAAELKNASDLSLHILNPATILQHLPPLEHTSDLEDVYSSCSIRLDPNQLLDASFTDIDQSYQLEKQLIFAEDTDFDASDDELRLLPSDDSAKGTVHDDDELDRLFSNESLPRMNLATILGLDIQDGTQAVVLQALKSHKDETADSVGLAAGFEERPAGSLGSSTLDAVNEFDDEFDEDLAELDASPIKPSKSSISYLGDARGLVSKKPSLSYIDHDDKHGLEYAFRNKSPEIPKYIKEDKKFKFIKIGKVQKFVNMFEEQKESQATGSRVGSRGGSRVGSRTGTRPASPVRSFSSNL
ncbi:hypothetical protein PUMCH_004860 [Australozyma saopauloensis]|uniref:Uncharacterized protein n=1 Tax=Australozyma saopauloensis TaxID=291208 RepID=A0AAX4HGT0_9ASCO|nr:hypothetical protein PUMCH_004860 [[Candida] saopauloensis]